MQVPVSQAPVPSSSGVMRQAGRQTVSVPSCISRGAQNVPSVQGLKSGLVVQVSKAAIGVSTCGAHTPARSWPGGSVTTKQAEPSGHASSSKRLQKSMQVFVCGAQNELRQAFSSPWVAAGSQDSPCTLVPVPPIQIPPRPRAGFRSNSPNRCHHLHRH